MDAINIYINAAFILIHAISKKAKFQIIYFTFKDFILHFLNVGSSSQMLDHEISSVTNLITSSSRYITTNSNTKQATIKY